jgi:homoserine kinase
VDNQGPVARGLGGSAAAAVAGGAYGAALSGAGSSLLALCEIALAPKVAKSLRSAAADLGVGGEVVPLAIDRRGLIVMIDGMEQPPLVAVGQGR